MHIEEDIKMNKKDEINTDFGTKDIKANIEEKELNKNPNSFQLILKVNLDISSYKRSYFEFLMKIHKLSNNTIGLLFHKKLIIVSLKSFQIIKIIEPNYQQSNSPLCCIIGNDFIDFIELENSNIVIWTSNDFLIYDKNYNLIQKIDEYAQKNKCQRKDYDYGTVNYYEINSMSELKNEKLISCNSYGLKFYEKDNEGKYNLILNEKMEIDANSLIEIKPNILIILHKHFDETFGDDEGEVKYLISKYNFETKSLKNLFYIRTSNMVIEPHIINYITSNKYLYMCYGYTMDIFDLENNLETIDIKNDFYEYKNDYFLGIRRMMKEEKGISKVLANYTDTLFFGKDNKGTKLYHFINNNLNVHYEFDYKCIIEVIVLKDNDFLLCSSNGEFYLFSPIFS